MEGTHEGEDKHEEKEDQKERPKKSRIGMLNMCGMKNEVMMKKLKREMIKNDIEVMLIKKTLEWEDRKKEIRKIFSEYDVIF